MILLSLAIQIDIAYTARRQIIPTHFFSAQHQTRLAEMEEALQPTSVADDDKPSLGTLSKDYEVLSYLADGGQAEVWQGKEKHTNRQVVIRFAKGLCMEGMARCRVHELAPDQLLEMRRACLLAKEANYRQYVRQLRISRGWQDGRRRTRTPAVKQMPHFTQCREQVSERETDLAFDIWDFAGPVTLAEGFLLPTSLGTIELADKRDIMRRIADGVATLSQPNVVIDKSICCCRSASETECRMEHNSWTRSCPSGYVDKQLDLCGPIVHHDLKFDNIMLSKSDETGDITPHFIDFGAAERCKGGKAHGHTKDFVPFWAPYGDYISPTECWSYDTYGVGVMWLTMELLAEMPAEAFMDLAFKDNHRRAVVHHRRAIAVDLDGPTLHSTLQDFEANLSLGVDRLVGMPSSFREDAVRPVLSFVQALRGAILKADSFQNSDEFVNAVHQFAEFANNTYGLQLAQPPADLLKADIFNLLRECPDYPVTKPAEGYNKFMDYNRYYNRYYNLSGIVYDDLVTSRGATLQCRLESGSQKRIDAVMNADKDSMTQQHLSISEVCKQFTEEKLPLTAEQDTKVKRSCDNHDTSALLDMIIYDNVDGMWAYFKAHAPEKGSERLKMLRTSMPDGETLLALAARHGSYRMVKLLLEMGANPFQAGAMPEKLKQNPENVASFLKKGFSGGVSVPLPPLMAAVSLPGNQKVLRALLDAAVEILSASAYTAVAHLHALYIEDVESEDPKEILAGPSLTSYAAQTGDVKMLQTLIDFFREDALDTDLVQAAVNGVGMETVPLIEAAAAGQSKMCRELLALGADPRAVRSNNKTALISAVESGSKATMEIVLAAAPELLNEVAMNAGTPLHVAVSKLDVRMVKALMHAGARASVLSTHRKETPLHAALQQRSVTLKMVRALVTDKECLRTKDWQELTPLSYLTRYYFASDSQNILKLLLKETPREARLYLDKHGRTALMIAASHGHQSAVSILAEKIPIDFEGGQGKTALMWAVMSAQYVMFELLIGTFGADAHKVDASGTPVAMMPNCHSSCRKSDIYYLIIKALVGAAGVGVVNVPDALGMTLLGSWAYDGDIDMVILAETVWKANISIPLKGTTENWKRIFGPWAPNVKPEEGVYLWDLVDWRIKVLERKCKIGNTAQEWVLICHHTYTGNWITNGRTSVEEEGIETRYVEKGTLIAQLKRVKATLKDESEKQRKKDPCVQTNFGCLHVSRHAGFTSV